MEKTTIDFAENLRRIRRFFRTSTAMVLRLYHGGESSSTATALAAER
jgi:hypothetical protein